MAVAREALANLVGVEPEALGRMNVSWPLALPPAAHVLAHRGRGLLAELQAERPVRLRNRADRIPPEVRGPHVRDPAPRQPVHAPDRDSPTFLRHLGVELTSTNRLALYVPPGFAHGFQTLEDDAEVWYQMTDRYQPGLSGGLRWDDPALGIEWPMKPTALNERDAHYPDLDRDELDCFRGAR